MFALRYGYTHPLVLHIPIEFARHNALMEDEGQETVSHRDVPICASLISAPYIDWNAVGRELGKVITLKPIKVVNVPEIAGGILRKNVPGCFILTDLSLVDLTENTKRPAENGHQGFPVAKCPHCVVCN